MDKEDKASEVIDRLNKYYSLLITSIDTSLMKWRHFESFGEKLEDAIKPVDKNKEITKDLQWIEETKEEIKGDIFLNVDNRTAKELLNKLDKIKSIIEKIKNI